MDLEVNMKCPHCGSAMVYEKFFGHDEHFSGWRCIFCGEIIDTIILENRGSFNGLTMVKDKWTIRRSYGR
jgi:transposase-like protein